MVHDTSPPEEDFRERESTHDEDADLVDYISEPNDSSLPDPDGSATRPASDRLESGDSGTSRQRERGVSRQDTGESGSSTLGTPEEDKAFWSYQSDNRVGYESTCGTAAAVCVLRQYGAPEEVGGEHEAVVEDTMLEYLEQIELSPAQIDSNRLAVYQLRNDGRRTSAMDDNDGAVMPHELAAGLNGFGVNASLQQDLTRGQLTDYVRNGQAVILFVNSDVLNDFAGRLADDEAYDHAVCLTGVEVNSEGKPLGFYLNDSGMPTEELGAGRFVDADRLDRCWEQAGGIAITCQRRRS